MISILETVVAGMRNLRLEIYTKPVRRIFVESTQNAAEASSLHALSVAVIVRLAICGQVDMMGIVNSRSAA